MCVCVVSAADKWDTAAYRAIFCDQVLPFNHLGLEKCALIFLENIVPESLEKLKDSLHEVLELHALLLWVLLN